MNATRKELSSPGTFPGAWMSRNAGLVIVCLGLAVPGVKADYFMNTGPLGTPRNKGTAALLSDGRVVICGGYNLNAGGYLASAERYDPSTGLWSPINPMGTARWEHTATTLGNGKILVAGGDGISGTLNSAELYDPTTQMWSPTPNMPAARHNHTATLLANGKVLVAGGQFGGVLATAALYDPTTGWSATTPMPVARYGHTATLLPNGKVLVAGGFNGSYLSSAYLFDPANNSWTLTTSPMTIGRYRHAASLLPNGKVLVTGGWNYDVYQYLATAELFDPATGLWTATSQPMSQGRFEHTSTLLANGKVLVAAGFGPGGPGGYQHLTSAELFDPKLGTFATTASLNEGREGHTATALPDARVLIAGGYNNTSGLLTGTELYIPEISTWTASGTLAVGRNKAAGTLLSTGTVMVVGGYNLNFGGYLASAELYDPRTALWTTINPMGTARWEHTATLLQNGQVLVAGGDGNSGTLSSAELYNPTTGGWTPTGPMPSARHNHTATLLRNGKVLMAGGQLGSFVTANVALYDPTSGWSATTPIPVARYGHTATLLPSGKVLVAGGWNGSYLSSAYLFDPANNSWTPTAFPMTIGRYRHAATLLPNGKVLVTGGWNYDVYQYLASAELYNPATDSWTATSQPMSQGRFEHTSTLLPDGKVLIAAGYGPGGSSGYLSASELYDPATDKFIGTGGLKAGRQGHVAIELPNGKVLVAAGVNNSGFTTGSELYGPFLVDPKSSGGKPFTPVVYASSGVQQNPFYQNPTAGYLINRRPDISLFWNSVDVGTWGFDGSSVPLNGILRVPTGNGPFPLAIFVHGNHLPPTDYSDPGYVYLCELLASWGILAATIDENFLNYWGCCGENDARAIVHLEHVRQFEIWNETPGHALYGKVNFNNVMLIGHSRGGEGVAHASYYNTYAGSNPQPLDGSQGLGPYAFNLTALAAIAPTDGQFTPPEGLDPVRDNYLIIHGSRDGDVYDFQGHKTYDRAHPIDITPPTYDNAEGYKALAWVVGANHNFFNSTWDQDGNPTLTRAQQENVARVYIGAMAQAMLLGRTTYLELLKNHEFGKSWLPTAPSQYVSQYQEAIRQFIDHYEEDSNPVTLSPPTSGANTWSASSANEMFFVSGPAHLYQETYGVGLVWNASSHYYQAAPTAPGLNAGAYPYFAIRIGQSSEGNNPPNRDQNLRIIIQDSAGGSTFFTASAFSRLVYPDTATFTSRTVMQTLRIPLSLIRERSVNVNNITAVKLAFDQIPAGTVYFDELQVSY
jgi:N-acetylneuraminic acid mutarotase